MTAVTQNLCIFFNNLKNRQPPRPPRTTFPFLTGFFLATLLVPLFTKSYPLRGDAYPSVPACTTAAPSNSTRNLPLLIILVISVPPQAPAPILPLYLFMVIPALNFLLLFTFVRFVRWYYLVATTAALFGLAVWFPPGYHFLCGTPIILLAAAPWLFLELLYAAFLLGLYEYRGFSQPHYRLFNFPPGNRMLTVRFLNRLANNAPAARALASRRIVDVAFSVIVLTFWLFLL